jgi:hypothetical protein
MDDVGDVSLGNHLAIQTEGGLYLVVIEHAEFTAFTDMAGQEKAPYACERILMIVV